MFAGAVISFCILQKQNAEKVYLEEESSEKDVDEESKPEKSYLKYLPSFAFAELHHKISFKSQYTLTKHNYYYYNDILKIESGYPCSIYSPPEIL